MKLAQILNRTRELNDVPRPSYIHAHCDVFRHCEIVNRREMKNARCFLLDQLEIDVAQCEARHTDVAFDDLKVTNASAGKLSDALDLFERARHECRLDEQDKIAVLRLTRRYRVTVLTLSKD